MEITIKFDLPAEETEALIAMQAERWRAAAHVMNVHFSECLEKGHQYPSADAALVGCKKLLLETLKCYDLKLGRE